MHMYKPMEFSKSGASQPGLEIISRPRTELKPDPAEPALARNRRFESSSPAGSHRLPG